MLLRLINFYEIIISVVGTYLLVYTAPAVD